MTTYKLLRIRKGRLFPLYVEHQRELEMGICLDARIGELADATHVKSRGSGNRLALRPGFHSTKVPFTDWIGKKGPDGRLYQRKHTVWCECEVDGDVEIVTDRNLRLQTLDNRGADRGLRLGSETDQPEGPGDSTETDQKGAEAALRCNSPA